MSKKYSIEITDDIVWTTFNSSSNISDIKNAIDEVSLLEYSYLKLWDFTPGFDLENSEVIELAEYAKRKILGPLRSAMVSPTDVVFGLIRMYEVHRENDQQDTRAFRNIEEAVEWLKS